MNALGDDRQKEDLSFALEAARVMAWDWNMSTGLARRSSNCTSLLGLDEEGPISDFYDLVNPADHGKIEAAIASARSGADYEIEYRVTTRDGRILWMLDIGHIRIDADTGDEHLSGLCMDISARKRAEEERNLLSEAAERLLQSKEPGETLRILFGKIGPHLSLDAYFNLMVDERGTKLQLVSCAGVREQEEEAVARLSIGEAVCGRVAQSQEPVVLCNIQESNDPAVQLVKRFGFRSYICHPLIAEQKLLGTLSFASRSRDAMDADEIELLKTITRYVAVAYERNRLVQELRTADRRKDEFLATLAHELRNPLAPIRNAIAVQRAAAGDADLLESSRRIMERQLQQMVRLIDDLLDVSRITRGRIELRKESINLAAVLHAAVETIQPLVDQAAQKIQIALPGDPITVCADRARLTQIFSNLLGNASKYTSRGGHIWMDAQLRDGEVVVTVRDDGIGIAPEHQTIIFEMFSQVVPAIERAQGGLGIGLSLVKGLVELHGGSVTVRSDGPGRGAEFKVWLPVRNHSPAAGQHLESLKQGAGVPPCKILVVDDNEDSAWSLATLLQLQRHQVRTAHDGEEAVRLAAEFQPELIFLDIGLPKLNGYLAAEQIRGQARGSECVLVAMTGWGQDEDKRRARQAGFDYHLTKPMQLEDVVRLLQTLTAQRRIGRS